MAMKVSAQATPRPETIPERRLFDRVRCMHSTATGPTVIDAATPTQMPRNITSKISNPIFFGCGVSGNKDTKNLGHPSRPREKRAWPIVGNGRYVDKISKTLAAELYIDTTSSPVRIPALYCIYSNRPGKSLWHISGMGYLSADLSR